MLDLATQVFGLLGTIVSAIVTALAVPNTVWKRRAILAIAVIGLVQLLFMILTWEAHNNTAYVTTAAQKVVAALMWLWSAFAIQTAILLVIGAACGWFLNDIIRKRRSVSLRRPDRRLWRSGDSVELTLPVNEEIIISQENSASFKKWIGEI